MKVVIILILSFLFSFQNSLGQDSKWEMAIYNIGLGGIVSGIGAVINKDPNDKLTKSFLKGFSKGAIGGYIVYESKNLIGKIERERKLEYGWAAKIVNSTGTSIIEGASLNNDFLSSWHLNIGFNRFELLTKDKWRVKYRIMPISFILTAYAAIGNKFEISNSLRSGELLFSNSKVSLNSIESRGINYGNVIVYNSSEAEYLATISHEIIHTFQYYDFNFVNTYFKSSFEKWQENSRFFRKSSKFLYYDFNGPFLGLLYQLENIERDNFYDNFFENEAAFWSNTLR
tara:strand:+ start:10484 stop:11341 length:858 start_codon:yes stop_codon:yes gene_type:complete